MESYLTYYYEYHFLYLSIIRACGRKILNHLLNKTSILPGSHMHRNIGRNNRCCKIDYAFYAKGLSLPLCGLMPAANQSKTCIYQ